MQTIELIPVKPEDTGWLGFIETLYTEAFPADERRAFQAVKELLVTTPAFHLTGIRADGRPAGLLSYWKWDDLAYVEHFAVDAGCRGGGLGAGALNRLLSQLDIPVVLEVEPPVDELSRRRIGFYERLGFRLWSCPYVQPPYDKDRNPLDLLLMTYGNLDLSVAFGPVRDRLYREVYGASVPD